MKRRVGFTGRTPNHSNRNSQRMSTADSAGWRVALDSTLERVITLLDDGTTQKDILLELGIAKSTLGRHTK
jgi:hypothetical protein